jgi:hypothetical protein
LAEVLGLVGALGLVGELGAADVPGAAGEVVVFEVSAAVEAELELSVVLGVTELVAPRESFR